MSDYHELMCGDRPRRQYRAPLSVRVIALSIMLAVLAIAWAIKRADAAVLGVTEGKFQVVLGNEVQPGLYDTFELCEAAKRELGQKLGATRVTNSELWLKCQKADRYRFGPAPTTPPPPTVTWRECAKEWAADIGGAPGSCQFTPSPSQVRFGDPASNRWSPVRSLASPVVCSSRAFGGTDPAPGVAKVCHTTGTPSTTTPTPPTNPDPVPTTGRATLSWQAPTTNTDNSPLTDLAGYQIVYGTSADELSRQVTLNSPGTTTHVIDGLTRGTWYFAVRAFSASGNASANSATASKAIP